MTKYALLIVDMQKAYFHNKALADIQDKIVQNCNTVIEFCAVRRIPMFTISTEHERDKSTWTLNMLEDKLGYLFAGDEDTKAVDGLDMPDAMSIKKTRDSAFFKTDLGSRLHRLKVDTLIIIGVSTQSCIMLTAADAYANNFKVILVTDAIATHDPRYHESTLKMLEKEYRQKLVKSEEILKNTLKIISISG